MIQELLALLQEQGLLLSDAEVYDLSEAETLLGDEDIADALWLAHYFGGSREVVGSGADDADTENQQTTPAQLTTDLPNLPAPDPSVPVTLPDRQNREAEDPAVPESGLPVEVQAAPALPDPLGLGRALRPLRRRVPSVKRQVLEEQATVDQVAAQDLWVVPVLKPERERWFDLELVIEASDFSFIWQETLSEFQQLLAGQGAFRNVRTWWIEEVGQEPRLVAKRGGPARSPKELVDPAGRRLVLLVSDCRSSLWHQGQLHDWLTLWGSHGPATVVQLLPERLWSQSALGVGHAAQVESLIPGAPNPKLTVRALAARLRSAPTEQLTVPVVTLDIPALKQWALVVAAAGRQRCPARLFDLAWVKDPERPRSANVIRPQTPEARLELFQATASPLAQELARRMAAVPVDPAVVQLIQQEILDQVRPIHMAEVYASSLMRSLPDQPDRYDFQAGVRDLLNRATPIDHTLEVFEALSRRIARTLGLGNIKSFTALLSPKAAWTEEQKASVLPFAQVATGVLFQLGGAYAELAQLVEKDAITRQDWVKPVSQEGIDLAAFADVLPLQEFGFTDARFGPDAPAFPPSLATETFTILTLEPEPEPDRQELEPFDIVIATVDRQGHVDRQPGTAHRYIETLPGDLPLEMVAIPSGSFRMGSPESETGRRSSESPQHPVTVASFFMGRYPVTQAQWRAVAALPQVEQKLETDPAWFKGGDRPVERVSWNNAQEFCARLSAHTGRDYRLPSEAEWEYACRAGTETPFHFGEMITSEVANYSGRSYDGGPSGERRGETTAVTHFGFANAFGLSDMHGNVREWCEDDWHGNYDGAPTDGEAWINKGERESSLVNRGGSWFLNPEYCRSAVRLFDHPGSRNVNLGFRVVCSAPRSLQ